MVNKAIELKNITYFYPNTSVPALENINLSIDYGEFIAIAGPSGGGKSTLCRIIVGLIPHVYGGSLAGEVYVDGVNVVDKGVKGVAGRVGIVLQIPENQIVNLIVEEEIAFPLENFLFDIDTVSKRLEDVLKDLEISYLRYRTTNTLSGGEIQKVVLASVLAYKPKILILDEPLAHLDPYSVRDLLTLLYKIHKTENLTIVVIEHRLTELIKYISRLIVLDRHVILDDEPRKALLKMMDSGFGRGIEIPPISKFFSMIKTDFPPINIDESIEYFTKLLNKDSIRCKDSAIHGENKDVGNSEDPVITVENLWYIYPNGVAALRNVNIDIYKGEFIALVGANGSGKTTLIKHLNGILKPSRGRVLVFGKDTSRCSVAELARYIGIVFQNPLHQFFKETVLEEVIFTAKSMGVRNADERATSILKAFNLHHLADRSPYEISVGEQRRLAIASILVYDPHIIALDEATAGIDFSLKMELLKILIDLVRKGKTVILATHDIEFLTYAPINRVIVLNNGEVVAQGPSREILYNDIVLAKARITPPQIPTLINSIGIGECIKPLNEKELYLSIKSGIDE